MELVGGGIYLSQNDLKFAKSNCQILLWKTLSLKNNDIHIFRLLLVTASVSGFNLILAYYVRIVALQPFFSAMYKLNSFLINTDIARNYYSKDI